LTGRIDLDARGLQRGDAENWLAVFFPKDDGGPNNVAHEFDLSDTDFQFGLRAIGQPIGSPARTYIVPVRLSVRRFAP